MGKLRFQNQNACSEFGSLLRTCTYGFQKPPRILSGIVWNVHDAWVCMHWIYHSFIMCDNESIRWRINYLVCMINFEKYCPLGISLTKKFFSHMHMQRYIPLFIFVCEVHVYVRWNVYETYIMNLYSSCSGEETAVYLYMHQQEGPFQTCILNKTIVPVHTHTHAQVHTHTSLCVLCIWMNDHWRYHVCIICPHKSSLIYPLRNRISKVCIVRHPTWPSASCSH